MNAIEIGPLVLDASRFAFVVGLAVYLAVAELPGFSKREAAQRFHASGLAIPLLIAWIIGARAGFIAQNFDSFAAQPLDVVKLWQGGFLPWAGFLTAGVVLAGLALRRWTSALTLGAAGGMAFAASLAVGALMPAPEAQLPNGRFAAMSGDDVALADIGKPIVLNLWASWCPPCRREMPMMLDLAAQSQDVAFVFANQGESMADIARFLAAEHLSGEHIVRDPEHSLMAELGAKGLPATLFFDQTGTLVASHTGEISRASLSQYVARLYTAQQ